MKTKLFLSLLSITILTNSFSQDVLNAGFENWTNAGTYEDPDNWQTLNFIALFGVDPTTFKDASANSGSYSARLETKAINFFGTDDTLTGLISQNKEMTAKPTSMEFFYKYSSPGADFGNATVTLTKWDDVNLAQITVASGTVDLNASATFKSISVPINYLTTDTPDSISITFLSSGSGLPIPNSMLNVDDVSLTMPVNGLTNLKSDNFSVFPNPVNKVLFIKSTGEKVSSIEVSDLLGRKVLVKELSNLNQGIDVSDLEEGNYLYSLKGETGNLLTTRKFVVKH